MARRMVAAMQESLSDPLRPGERHLFRISVLGEGPETLDYLDGDDILLHLSLRPASARLVVNDRIDGGWGTETGLTLPAGALNGLEVALTIGATVEVEAAGCRLRHGPLRGDLCEARRLRGTAGFSRLRPPRVEGGPWLRLDACHAPGGIRGQVGGFGEASATLHLRVAEEEVARLALPPGPGPRRFAIPAPEGLAGGAALRFLCRGAEGDEVALGEARFARRLRGALEHCGRRGVRGWAAPLDAPGGQPLLLEVLVDGRPLGQARADRPRPDLAAADPDLARRGFLFHFPEPLDIPPGEDRAVTVRVAGTGIELRNSPWRLGRASASPLEPLREEG
ncbi:hypothetical protein [Teichococcus aerofrigidensis]